MGEPNNPGSLGGPELREPPLHKGPFLVKVDRYGSVSGLVRVRVPLGMLVIRDEGVPYGGKGSTGDEAGS